MTQQQLNAADLEKAIQIITKARKTHQDWLEYLYREPEAAKQPAPIVNVAGNIEKQQGWIADYNLVLEVLESFRGK